MLLGDELDKQVQIALRGRGAVVNTTILLVCAEGIITNKDINLLSSNGRHTFFLQAIGERVFWGVWDVTHTENHWSNERTMVCYICTENPSPLYTSFSLTWAILEN